MRLLPSAPLAGPAVRLIASIEGIIMAYQHSLHRGLRVGVAACALLSGVGVVPALSGPAAAQAQAAGDLDGRVTDASGRNFFAGASVRIVELDRSTVTDRSGRFRFDSVPAGEYTVVVTYIGAPAVTQTVTVASGGRTDAAIAIGEDVRAVDNILVVGQRSNLSRALNRQRNADNLLNAITSDFIGQFPDQNVTEAAQRISGVSINRDQGEGRSITIRGANSNLNSTTINGQRVTTADGDERSLALDVIPSELLETLQIAKTLTPDMDGDGIGGAINIETSTAFDRDGFSATLSAEGSYNDLRDKISPRLNGSFSDIYDLDNGGQIGISASLSYFRRQLGSDGVENGDGLDDVAGVTFPVVIEPRDYVLIRERLGGSVNLDWRVNNDQDLFIRTLYSEFADDEIQGGTVYEADPDDGANVASADGDRLLFENQEVESYVSEREETQTIFSVVAGGETRAEDWTFNYQVGYSDAGEDNPDYIEPIFVADFSGVAQIGTDLTDPRRPEIITSNASAFADASLYELDEIVFESSVTEDTEWSARLDARREMIFAGLHQGYVQFGLKGSWREKTGQLDALVYGGGDAGLTVADFLNPNIDYPLGPIAPQAYPRLIGDYIRNNIALFEDELDEEGSFIDSNFEDYTTNEDIYAAYAMASADIDALRLVGGLRVEHTEYATIGNQILLDENTGELSLTPSEAEDSYTDLLPSLNARYEVNEDVLVRAAYFRSVVRPIFEQNRPAGVVEREDGEAEAEAGNPDLERFKADNVDFALEYYTGGLGLMSVGVFGKRLQNPVYTADLAGQGDFAGFDEYVTFINGDDAYLYGLEIGFQQELDTLSPILEGFIVSANYTRVETDAEVPNPDGGSRDAPLPGQSANVANASLGYDRAGFQTRLSVSYRDRFLDEIGDPEDPSQDVFIDDHVSVDLTASYRINDTFQIFGQASNLNDRPLYSYTGRRNVNVQYEEYGYSAALGVRATF